MIFPSCGFIDNKIIIPEITRRATLLGVCEKCGILIYANPTSRTSEVCKNITVMEGESWEESLINYYLKYENGEYSKKRGDFDDIDREIYDNKNNLIGFAEIKERTNTLNAYRITKFPYAKILTARELIKKHHLPVFVILKFSDAWTRISIQLEKEYNKGSTPFYPKYRPEQKSSQKQIPVLSPVEELEFLKWMNHLQFEVG